MAKKLNIDMSFKADTSQAKAQIAQLQQQLNALSSANVKTGTFDSFLANAKAAKTELAAVQTGIQQAFNADTGKFDLSKFQATLKAAGTDINQVQAKMAAMGPEGQKAFATLANSIISAQAPMHRMSGLLTQMTTVLANTVKWQIASSAMHSITGAIQGAYYYAQDLNESLNNIRIVTGKSADEMAIFAKQANEAAKALSTTTTEYTDAALIYYQQGLDGQAVLDRADTTIKLANVSRQSAETVSSQMTAIWNNFAKGGENLEYYADVLTKLGATTASSSSEIAQGLEKFAAVADTVGLSYEYASAALATVTATTRQSADVVGTAFKTLFARIEGLKLGDTLDDGTTLNQYSQALEKVGVSIKDSNGELRDMDDILNNIGDIWNDLNKAQQVALAEQVAGVRQYNQFLALMDNWDFMQKNLETVRNANGELEKQAEIYAESWEAAQDRVRASLESVYSQFLDDDFFIGLTNGLASVVQGFDKFVDTVGGAKTILTALAAVFMRMFSGKIAQGLSNTVYGFKSLVGLTEQENNRLKAEVGILAQRMQLSGDATQSQRLSIQYAIEQAELQETLNAKAKNMSPLQKAIAETYLAQTKALDEQVIAMNQELETSKKLTIARKAAITTSGKGDFQTAQETANTINTKAQQVSNIINKLKQDFKATGDVSLFDTAAAEIQKCGFAAAEFQKKNKDASLSQQALNDAIKEQVTALKAAKLAYNENEVAEEQARQSIDELVSSEQIYTSTANKATRATENNTHILSRAEQNNLNLTAAIVAETGAQEAATAAEKAAAAGHELTKQKIQELARQYNGFSNTVTQLSQALMSLTMAFSAINSLQDTLNDDTLSSGQKLVAVIQSLSMALMGFTMAQRAFKDAELGAMFSKLAINIGLVTVATEEATVAEEANTVAKEKSIIVSLKNVAVKVLEKSAYLGIALAIGAAVAAIYLYIKSQNSANDKAIKAQKQAKQLAEAYDDVKKSVQEAASTLEELGKKEDEIAKLKYGTAEWATAIQDANTKAMELLNTYGLLSDANAWYKDSQGLIHITDEGQQKITEAGQAKVREASLTSMAADSNARAASSAAGVFSTATDLARAYNNQNNILDSATGEKGAFLRSIGQPPVSGINEESINALVKGLSSDLYSNFENIGIEEMVAMGVDRAQAELIASNDTLKQDIVDLANATRENTAAYKLSVEGIVQSDLLNNEQFNAVDEEYKTGIVSAMSGDIESLVNQRWQNETISNRDKEAYYKAAGYTKNENGQFVDANDEKAPEILDETIQRWKAENKIIKEVEDNLEDYIALIENSKTIWEKADKIVEKYGDSVDDIKDNAQELFESGDLADFLQFEGDELDPEFIVANATTIQQALTGDADAYDALQKKLAHDLIANIEIADDELREDAAQLVWQLDEDLDDIEIGAKIDNTQFLTDLETLVKDTGMTAEQLQKYLELQGFEGVSFLSDIKVGEKESLASILFNGGRLSGKLGQLTVNRGKRIINRAPAITTGNGGKDSGSGSGKGSKKDAKLATDEIDRNHELIEVLHDLQNAYDMANESASTLWGAGRLPYIDKEIEAAEKMLHTQEQLNGALKAQAEADWQAIEKYGFIRDKDGRLSNYTEVFQKQLDIFNAARTDAAEDAYNTFKKLTEQYEESLNNYEDGLKTALENYHKWLSAKLSKITVKVELQEKFDEFDIVRLEGELKHLSKMSFSGIEQLAVMGEKVAVAFGEAETKAQAIKDIDALWQETKTAENPAGVLTQEEMDRVLEYYQYLIDLQEQLDDAIIANQEKFNDAITESTELLQRDQDMIDDIASVLDHLQNIAGLLNTKDRNTLGLQTRLATAQSRVAGDAYSASKERVKFAAEAVAEAEKLYNNALATGDKLAIEEAKKSFDEASEAYNETYDDMLGYAEKSLKAFKAEYEASIKEMRATLESELAQGYDNLDDLQAAYKRQKNVRDQVINRNQQTYELNKMGRTINGDIANTQDLRARELYKNYLDQINDAYLEIGENGEYINQMSQYDVDYMKAKYELLKAQIALEDAQNAKTQMRLSRDASGNYTYVYTADQSQIDKASQDYEDKLYNIQKLSTDTLDKIKDQIAGLGSEWADALDAAMGDPDKIAEINEYYGAIMESLYDQASTAYDNLQTDYGTYADDVIMKNGEMTNSIEDYQKQFDIYSQQIIDKWGEYQIKADAVAEDINAIQIPELEKKSAELADKTKTDTENQIKYIQAVEEEVKKWTNVFTEEKVKIGNITAEITGYVDRMRDAIVKDYDAMATAARAAAAAMNATNSKGGSGGGNGSGSDKVDDSAKKEPPAKATYTVKAEGPNGKFASRNGVSANELKSMAQQLRDSLWNIQKVPVEDWVITNNLTGAKRIWNLLENIKAFDTGGYTGEWGPRGRLAMLHEKELVLNSSDTQNILSAVSLVRDLAKAIGVTVNSAAGASSSLAGSLARVAGVGSAGDNAVQQVVSIDANFPSVQSAREIEEALNNLVNDAIQYAHKRI